MSRLSDKIALVTGGAVGLGAAIAKRFAEEGARVYLTDLNEDTGAAVAKEIGGVFLPQDVTDEARWQAIYATIADQAGGLDILVNNAGLAVTQSPPDPENGSLDDLHRIFKVNVDGVFLGCKYGIPQIAKRGGGAIVNMSSIAALVPTPFITAYGASKGAVAQYTRSIALHCAQMKYNIRCNSVHPGQVRTPMHDKLIADTAAEHGLSEDQAAALFMEKIPMGCYQQAVDIANAVLFLASDEARYITGQKMVVDGGMSLVN